MIRPETDELIAFLNSLLESDPYAIAELLTVRVPCNQTLADHPTVQVAAGPDHGITFIRPGEYRVGILGILNGYCGSIEEGPREGWGPIAAVYDINDDTKETKLVKFVRSETFTGGTT